MTKHMITLRVSLEPKLYRDFEISGEASLYEFAQIINEVFGFDFDHVFGFYDNLKTLTNPKPHSSCSPTWANHRPRTRAA